MDRRQREFLTGFERAAMLVQQLLASQSTSNGGKEYLEDVADLHADSDDLVRRGLAVGCLSAVGK